MKCPNCGKVVPPNQKYCFYCGIKVEAGNPAPADNSAGNAAPADNSAGNSAAADSSAGNSAPVEFSAGNAMQTEFTFGNAAGTEQKNNHRTRIVILLTVLLTILLIAFIAYWFSRKGTSPASSAQPGSTLSGDSQENLPEDLQEEPPGDPQDIEPETDSADPQYEVSDQSEIEYSVVCVSSDTGKTLQKSVYTGKIGEDITLNAPVLPDLIPMQDEMTITLTENASENIMLFMYSEIEREASSVNVDIPDEDVLYFNGHTYYAVRTGSITSFREANAYCMDRGGYLASINSDAENSALYDYVFYDRGYESAYFGFTDDGSEDEWYWSNGDPVTYTNWGAKQPDNLGGVENYALFYYEDTPYKWNDGDFGVDARGTVTFLIEWDTQ